ncbi:MAG TPA: nucleotidyl transferase AbiEii/AbiGii toxin family protein, partial [Xanthomonadales bacterium]|nr:nucleotidyl transferase AbiEii/AbiGii toxin family protein [Xanthomonadales bacterium]
MGETNFFTPEQTTILTEISKDSYLRDNFYFTGGTALSYLYLKHRHSEDLDFFSENKIDQERIFGILSDWSKKINFSFTAEFKDVVYVFFLTFKSGVSLKVDF